MRKVLYALFLIALSSALGIISLDPAYAGPVNPNTVEMRSSS